MNETHEDFVEESAEDIMEESDVMEVGDSFGAFGVHGFTMKIVNEKTGRETVTADFEIAAAIVKAMPHLPLYATRRGKYMPIEIPANFCFTKKDAIAEALHQIVCEKGPKAKSEKDVREKIERARRKLKELEEKYPESAALLQ